MTNIQQSMAYAAQLIEQARGEENETGNPLTAVRCYTTAMEIIASSAATLAESLSTEQRRFFFFQIRGVLQTYHKRAELLLSVSDTTGLVDKPGDGSLPAAVSAPSSTLPAQYSSDAPVMGLPISPGGTGGAAGEDINIDDLLRSLGAPPGS